MRSGGVEGHIVDMSHTGGYKFTTTLLLRLVGRKSGTLRINPLIYGVVGGEIAIVASKGGAARHPAWYFNLKSSSEVSFQIATQAFRATWREPRSDERARAWDYMIGAYPPYKSFQASTSREIPLVLLSATERTDLFLE